jgi:hypothetical protein
MGVTCIPGHLVGIATLHKPSALPPCTRRCIRTIMMVATVSGPRHTLVVPKDADLDLVARRQGVCVLRQPQRRQRGACRRPGAAQVAAQHVLRVPPALRQPPHLPTGSRCV